MTHAGRPRNPGTPLSSSPRCAAPKGPRTGSKARRNTGPRARPGSPRRTRPTPDPSAARPAGLACTSTRRRERQGRSCSRRHCRSAPGRSNSTARALLPNRRKVLLAVSCSGWCLLRRERPKGPPGTLSELSGVSSLWSCPSPFIGAGPPRRAARPLHAARGQLQTKQSNSTPTWSSANAGSQNPAGYAP